MLVGIQDEILRLHSMGLLQPLLVDQTTKKNIVWATDVYRELGSEYGHNREILPNLITGNHSSVIKNRARKAMEQQSERTRKHAEVFTPLWVCKKMISYADAMWFGKTDAFLDGDAPSKRVTFPKRRKWQRYVDSKRLEITCGEAPYLVNRYDVSSGEILPIASRHGILDRKLRVIDENTTTETEWLEWTLRAFQATYGYEYQGDNLLIARVNLLMTFEDYLGSRWHRKPTYKEYNKYIRTITWNAWQMDGLSNCIPYSWAADEARQTSLFDLLPVQSKNQKTNKQSNLFDPPSPPKTTNDLFDLCGDRSHGDSAESKKMCRLNNWRRKRQLDFSTINAGSRIMKFDFVIGNPPYQGECVGNMNFAPAIYHLFIDAAIKVSDRVELIHPARFLFNAGSTPKAWNQKMLNDEHFKVLDFEMESCKIFPNTDIKGGVAITYYDANQNFGAIGTFVVYPELMSIMRKTQKLSKFTLDEIVTNRGTYRFSNLAYEEEPEEMKKVTDSRVLSAAFERFPKFFFDNHPQDNKEYIRIYGKENGDRVYKWIRKDYVEDNLNLYKYKIMVPTSNGSGALGEVLSTPLIGEPLIGFTETFISIGLVDTREEAEAILKYVKSKFARTMLGVLKITQSNTRKTWRMVPLQDFTSQSDIDWSKSIADIDRQLYEKYGLADNEIEFIETHVKEMV